MVLTKTTAIFLLPSTFFLIWHAYGYKLRESLKPALIVALSAVDSFQRLLPSLRSTVLFLRLPLPFRSQHLGPARDLRPEVSPPSGTPCTAHSGSTPGSARSASLCCFSLWSSSVTSGATRSSLPRWWPPPDTSSSSAGTTTCSRAITRSLAWPLVFFIALATQALFTKTPGSRRSAARLARPLAYATVALAAIVSADNLRQILHWTRHPEYTWITAANQLTSYIDQHPNGNRLLLSISGDNITLITHLPAICDDFGTWDLPLPHPQLPAWLVCRLERDRSRHPRRPANAVHARAGGRLSRLRRP